MFVRQPISNKVADMRACKVYGNGLCWNELFLKKYVSFSENISKIVVVFEYLKFPYDGIHN